jgi:hypothetical protein
VDARVNHAKEAAAHDAWLESSKEDGPCSFQRNPYRPDSTGECLNAAMQLASDWNMAYDYAVSKFLDSLPEEKE